MQSSVDIRKLLRHEGTIDLPPTQEATISLGKSTNAEPVTMADFRSLLTKAVNQFGIPDTALVIDDVRLAIQWT